MRDHWSNDKGGESFNRSWFLRKEIQDFLLVLES